MLYTYQLKNILTSMEEEKGKLDKKILELPSGKLYFNKVNGKKTFMKMDRKVSLNRGSKRKTESARSYLTRRPELVNALLLKEYYMSKSRLLEQNIENLGSAVSLINPVDFNSIAEVLPKRIRNIPNEILKNAVLIQNNLPDPVKDNSVPIEELSTTFDGDLPEIWGGTPYRENQSHPENKIHRGYNELLFRSKSELLISGLYEKNQIPYHYDEIRTHKGYWISPDFTFISNSGAFIYHEHWGLTNMELYLTKSIEKLNIYADAGIIPGKNLIITTDNEDGSIDLKLIEEIIRLYHSSSFIPKKTDPLC